MRRWRGRWGVPVRCRVLGTSVGFVGGRGILIMGGGGRTVAVCIRRIRGRCRRQRRMKVPGGTPRLRIGSSTNAILRRLYKFGTIPWRQDCFDPALAPGDGYLLGCGVLQIGSVRLEKRIVCFSIMEAVVLEGVYSAYFFLPFWECVGVTVLESSFVTSFLSALGIWECGYNHPLPNSQICILVLISL